MSLALNIFAVLLPALFLFFYAWKKDTSPDPPQLLLKAFISGALVFIPFFIVVIIVILFFTSNDFFLSLLLGAPTSFVATALLLYFVIAFPLELSKLFALESILLKNPYYEEHYDGVVYAICVGLGNATSMSLLCIIYYRDLFSFTDALFLALFLAIGDYICSVLMGYFYSIYRFEDGRKVAKYRILWWPMVAHFIFFLLLFYVLQPLNEIWTIVCLIALIVICVVLTNYAKKKLLSFWLNKNEKKKDAVTVETP